MLPHFARPDDLPRTGRAGRVRAALGDPDRNLEAAAGRAAKLAARSGHTRLSTLGVEEEHLPPLVEAVMRHPALANTPDPPDEDELLALLRDAL